jgi:VIT1/CCC1 family predicted Fe2+/Mn2+ transporter
MADSDRIIELLTRIEENQRKALETQRQHVQIAQAQLDRSNNTIQESIELQRTAVARQAQIAKFVLPLIGALLVLLAYLLIKYRIF